MAQFKQSEREDLERLLDNLRETCGKFTTAMAVMDTVAAREAEEAIRDIHHGIGMVLEPLSVRYYRDARLRSTLEYYLNLSTPLRPSGAEGLVVWFEVLLARPARAARGASKG